MPRILKNLLSKLRLKCDHESYGCTQIVRLEVLHSHLQDCEFNPKKPVMCSSGCEVVIAKDEMKNHNCIRELRKVINDHQSKINQLSNELTKQKMDLEICTSELRILKAFATKHFKTPLQTTELSTMHHTSVFSGASGAESSLNLNATDEDEIARWSATLPLAKISRWGGIISTPDAVLQAMIKRALIELNCSTNILNDLMENAHERHWPPGLNTLETRQINRALYSNFVCKRIANKQAVLLLACDNRHMSNHMIVEPGIILIFAHGVE